MNLRKHSSAHSRNNFYFVPLLEAQTIVDLDLGFSFESEIVLMEGAWAVKLGC